MFYKIVLYLLLISAIAINAQQKINIRGKILNQNDKPISNAVVTLVSKKLSDTTTSDGTYEIVDNNVGTLQTALHYYEKIIVNKNGVIQLSLDKALPVTIEIYDIKGKVIKSFFYNNISHGIYHLMIDDIYKNSKLLLIRIQTGDAIHIVKYIRLSNGKNIVKNSRRTLSENISTFSKVAEIIDSLEASATGYQTKKLPIFSYDTVVNIVLDSITTENQCEGCGKSNYPQSGKHTIVVDNLTREYILKIPNNYDPNKPYKLIFCFHPWGGDMNQIANQGYYGLERLSNGTAIFVSPNGLEDNGQPRGWANPNGRDIKFVKEMLKYFNSNLCIDQKRIFSTGFSYGGMISDAIGCALNNTFRAIAPMSGAFYSGCDSTSKGPIAVWMAHGKSDVVVPLANGQQALRYFLARNGCSNQTTPVNPSPCVAYQGCKEGFPVIYCEFNGGHAVQNWSAAAIWEFFSQF